MDNSNKQWSNVYGCGILHPFNKAKQDECENEKEAKKASKAKNMGAMSDLELAKAAADKANKPSTSWTATQTAMVVGVSLLGIAIMVAIIIKVRNKNKG